MKNSTLQKGFTLIELIVVIVILGVLAVTAAPRLINMSDDAHLAVTRAEYAAFRSAVNLVHSKYLIKQTSPLEIASGISLPMTSEGYPLGTGSTMTRCADIWNKLLADPQAITAANSFTTDLDAGWYYLGTADICAYGKSLGGESFQDGNMAHFVYFLTDYSVSFGGITYAGKAGDVVLYNAS